MWRSTLRNCLVKNRQTDNHGEFVQTIRGNGTGQVV
jgi:hypothetical protein